MIIEVADQWFLGVVRKYQPENTIPFAQIEPLYCESEDGRRWERIEDREHVFPNRGLVTWYKPLRPPSVGSVWQFRVELQPTFDGGNPRHERYKTLDRSAPLLVREVIDFGGATESELRRRLLESPLWLGYEPHNPVYFKIAGEHWYGPVTFKQDEGRGVWIPDVSQPVPLAAPLPKDALTCIDLAEDGGRRLFFGPSTKTSNGTGQVDWAPDAEIVKRVLKALGKHNRRYSEQLGLTERSIDLAVQELWANGDGTVSGALLKYRVERAQQAIKQLRTRHDLLMQLESELVALPSVKDRLAQYEREEQQRLARTLAAEHERQRTERFTALDDEIAAAKTKAAGELQRQIQTAQQRLQTLEGKAAAAQRKCDELAAKNGSLHKEIAEQEEKLRTQVDAFETALLERLEKLVRAPQDVLADVAIFRAALGVAPAPVERKPEQSQESLRLTQHAGLSIQAPEGQPLTDFNGYRKAVRNSFKQSGLPSKLAAPLHAALQSGAMPLLWGADSYAVVQAYADAVLGGCAHWLPVSAAIVQWSELFGSYDGASRRFLPAAGGLADLVVEAQLTPDRLHMVVLDGVNRAAVEMYLEPLLAIYSDAQTGRPGRRLSAVHPSCLDDSDPYYILTGFQWPANLLSVGILADGVALSLPSSIWRYAAWIDVHAGAQESEEWGQIAKTAAVKSYVPASIWRGWRAEAQRADDDDSLRSLLESLAASGAVLSRAERQIGQALYDAATMWFKALDDPAKASLALAVISCVAPQVAAHVQAAGADSLLAALQQHDIEPEPVLAALESLEKVSG